MNLYDFEHPSQDRGKRIYAKNFQEAEAALKAENGNEDSWNLIRAWDEKCILTWDIFRSDKQELPPNIP